MKKDQYFSLEVNFLSDDQLFCMMEKSDNPTQAFGVYVMLLLHLRKKDNYEASCSDDFLSGFCRRERVGKEDVKQVLFDSGLFVVNEEAQTFRSPYLDRVMEPLENRWRANVENGKKGGRPKKVCKTPETPATTGEKPKLTQENKREEKNTVTTIEYNSSNSIQEEPPAAASVVISNNQEKGRCQTESRGKKSVKPFRQEPVRSWEELVDEMGSCEEYMSMVAARSRLGILLTEHREYALKLFKNHIHLYDKGSTLQCLRDVKQYFTNCMNNKSLVCQRFRDALQKEREKVREKDPYRFETVKDGKRSYFGRPIPKDAPPRPDNYSMWDDSSLRWVRCY